MGTTPTEQHRLTRSTRSDSRLGGPDAPPAQWRVVYAFSEEEFFPTDFESANFAVYHKPGGYFSDKILASKHFWLNDEEACTTHKTTDRSIETRHVGRFGMEGAVIRRHIGSHTDIVRTLTTEAERAEALREFFGIHISIEALEYIRGRESALCE
ncbi:hypothetical protein C0995_013120 [Termitomyces sp. Mi166|nr:hypothetical protein C0995_013120 [Termitomyces sp. Mi166\